MTAILCPNCKASIPLPVTGRRPLTKRQRQVFDFVRSYNAEHGYSPTYEEMMQHMDCAAGTIVGLVKELRQRGWVRTAHLKARSIQIIGEDASA